MAPPRDDLTALDDFVLLDRWAADKDKPAANALLERHFRTLHRFFINKVPEATVPDLIQETMLECVRALPGFRRDSSFRTYLLSIARNVLLHYYRRHKRKEGRLDPLTDSAGEQVDPAGMTSLLAKRHEQELLLAALRAIPIDHQVVIELYFWEGLTAKECAFVLEITEVAVKGRLHRAKIALRKALEGGAGSVDEKRSITSAMASWILGIHEHVRKGSPEEERIVRGWDDADEVPQGA